MDKYKANITSCEKILKELNPVYARESERDQAIDELTEKVNGMQDEFSSIKSVLSNIENLLNRR
jgi:endonuclease IV